MSDDMKKDIIERIITNEGGYVNDPHDLGGETNYGITIKTARLYGYDGNMKDITKETACNIYSELYWDNMKLDVISSIENAGYFLVLNLMDCGVNLGVKRSSKFLQKTLNALSKPAKDMVSSDNLLSVDGFIGGLTIDALAKQLRLFGPVYITEVFKSFRIIHYANLALEDRSQSKFIYGWLNRVKEL